MSSHRQKIASIFLEGFVIFMEVFRLFMSTFVYRSLIGIKINYFKHFDTKKNS